MNKVLKTGFVIFVIFLIFCSISSTVKAQNPIVPDVGMAYPHIRIYNNKAYLFTTPDADKNAKTFVMPDWHIWSSDDLVNWKHELLVKPTKTCMGESINCWANDVGYKNGNYYFYFSNGSKNKGVMVGVTPAGPFKDARWKPMRSEELTTTKEYEPKILIDDDKNNSAHIAFGRHRDNDSDLFFCIAKLNEDMISLAEKPREIRIIGDAGVLTRNDKPTLHKKKWIYYLSVGTHYASSDNIYGPYTKRGNSGNDNFGLISRAHGNYFDWKNQSFHTWCHFHLEKYVARYHESIITYLNYKENGEMVSDVDFLDAHFATGVGQYDATWDKIHAEWYMAATMIEKNDSPNGGFEITNGKKEASLYFPNISNLEKVSSITFFASSVSDGTIKVYADSKDGKLLATCKIPNTGGREKYREIQCDFENTEGIDNLYLR